MMYDVEPEKNLILTGDNEVTCFCIGRSRETIYYSWMTALYTAITCDSATMLSACKITRIALVSHEAQLQPKKIYERRQCSTAALVRYFHRDKCRSLCGLLCTRSCLLLSDAAKAATAE